ncbi:MAG: SusC/RagA family TonB-linked outer membrane protein [Bacteroidaceae bacterium]|nr:SusC/RagA family TonB-linked outer membrane protein [Prevotella sp.]MBO7602751.1 SusC/RagA family TonB-linked outer membrane protein [Bacteroidaceae bacterium]
MLLFGSVSSVAQTADDAEEVDTTVVKKKVHVAFRDKDPDHLLGGISYVDMEELQKKDYTQSSLEDMYALVGGWNGNNLWGMDNDRLDNNDNNNLPLVIIDGVKRPSNNVLPSEIEQITFLKGAQAVVLYGAKGAKGAILITTKRGTVDGLQIKANANTGFHVAKEFPEYIGSAEYMTLFNEARVNDGLDPLYSQMDIYNHASGVNPYRYPNVNYYSDEYIRKVYNRSEGTLEIQGGGQRAHFYTNINYYRSEDLLNFGEAKDNYTDRFSVRGNVDLVINKVIKGFANASATFYNEHKNKGDFWGQAATMLPNYPENAAPLIPIDMVDPNASMALAMLGKSLNLLDGKYFPGGTKNTPSNAIADCYFGGKTQAVSRQFQFDAGFVYDMNKFVQGLSFKTLFSIDYAANYSLSYDNQYAVFIPTWSNYSGEDAIVGLTQQGDEIVTGRMTMSDTKYRQTISWNGHFDYDHIFADKHHVSGILLANMYTTTASGTYHRYANANLGLQVGYDFMSRYFAEVGLAGVHSARLAEGHREALSPSFTIGWNLARERFMEGSFVDDLMLSASYSDLREDMDVYMGNNEYYIYDALWSNTGGTGFSWNEGTSVNHTVSTMGANPSLDFIHRKEWSVSLRGSFFNKLISTDLTFFNTNMDGFVVQNPTSFPSHLQGNGSSFKPALNNNIQNRKGIDFSVTAQKQFGQVHAALGVVGTWLKTNNSKYDEIVQYDYQKVEGHSLDAIRGYKCLGFYDVNDFDYNAETGKYALKAGLPTPRIGGTIQPGDLRYEDVNNDGIIDSNDQVDLGKSGAYGAPLTLGLNLTLKYKNWTLFMLGNGQFGAYALKNNSYYYMDRYAKYSVNIRGRWTPETAATATHPRLTQNTSANNAAASTFWIYSTDRFNIRKIQLTYDFPQEMFEGKWVKALSIYLNGNDLLTISKNRKIMETSVGYAPQTRFYNLGVKVTL